MWGKIYLGHLFKKYYYEMGNISPVICAMSDTNKYEINFSWVFLQTVAALSSDSTESFAESY